MRALILSRCRFSAVDASATKATYSIPIGLECCSPTSRCRSLDGRKLAAAEPKALALIKIIWYRQLKFTAVASPKPVWAAAGVPNDRGMQE